MTDIVERLYEMADDITLELAAQTITRLRSERDAARAETERLRAAAFAVLNYALMAEWLDKPRSPNEVWGVRKSDLLALRNALPIEYRP